MKNSGAMLGVAGGVAALIAGALGNYLGGTTYSAGDPSLRTVYLIMSVVLPMLGILGAGLVFRSPKAGARLMALAAFGMAFVFGADLFTIRAINLAWGAFYAACAGLLLVGALIVALDQRKAPQEST